MKVLEKKIGDIVSENYIYARALYYLGVDFYKFKEDRLIDLCESRGIERGRIIRCFYQFDSSTRLPFEEINSYPLELTLELLRYEHHSYIKYHLPYVAHLIHQLDPSISELRDLKLVFPLFIEDFIKHIYEEEDEIFGYISFLIDVQQNKESNIGKVWKFGAISLTDIRAHHVDEDETAGLRELLNGISDRDLLTNVILKELRAFDREILYHAEIENEI
ncbi:MAG: hypothetical protein MI865_01335, partial [Proteobacteria bacterium]|nr:hypothetical protein [Pseudomonadota bacterium]